jgi:ABC-type branched-subunit amino acid transport system ATPase component
MTTLLGVEGISKRFGGLQAVDSTSFTVEPNTITSLIGPNGAGKTTVFNIISGFLKPDSGTIMFRGQPVAGLEPYEISQRGMARTFQDPRVFAQMSVLENVLVGLRQKGESPLWALLGGKEVDTQVKLARERAEHILATTGLIGRARERASALSFGEQRFLSIARTLISEPDIILLDEPTVGLDRASFGKLIELMMRLVSDVKKTILLIEHNMSVVMSISAKVILMVQGTVVASGSPQEIRSHRSMVEAYLGKGHVA